tara:strand:+ start:2760 stop:3602 length:843 start_codon:yes stop_codon:yes gene_type:complete
MGLSDPDATTKLARLPAAGYCTQYITPHCGSTCSEHSTSYNYYRYPLWCVPDNVCDVIFEVWGAGGGGGSSCCCSRGIPGGAGAYAWKRVQGASIANCVYDIHIGTPGCGRMGSQCGQMGNPSYITGYGLSNFCAKGGGAGCSCCFLCCCTWRAMCLSSCPYGCCSEFYGADGGARGVPGAAYMFCYNQHCYNKQHVPYPAGLVNGKGGWMTGVQCENSGCGYCLLHWSTAQLGWGGSFSEHNFVPGVGGPSGWTCGGGCCHGQNGTAGMIRINYKIADP